MSKSNSCISAPGVMVKGKMENSRMFSDLVSKKKLHYSRDLALTIYANYLNSDIEEKMGAVKKEDGSPKYIKNRQGQYNAKDVVEFLGIEDQLEEVNNFQDEELKLGAVKSKGGSRVNYYDAEEVLNKVNDFNNTHKRLVADIEEHYTQDREPFYNILVYESNHNTMAFPLRTKTRLRAWEIYKQVFNSLGIDITDMPRELYSMFNANNIGLCDQLKTLTDLSPDNLYKKDVLTLLYIDKDSETTKRVVNSFGSIEEVAQAWDDRNHKNNHMTKEQQHLVMMAINHAKKLRGLDIKALVNQIDKLQSNIESESLEIKLQKKIQQLDKKFHIGLNIVNDLLDNIETLSDAYRVAITQLKRRISEVRKEKGRTEEVKRLETLLNKLVRELSIKSYYSGMIDYLMEAGKVIPTINEILQNIPQTGDSVERLTKEASALRAVQRIKEQYYDIIKALASDNITMNEVESQTDIDHIKQMAKELLRIFNGKEAEIHTLTKNFVKDFLRTMCEGKIKESEINDVLNRAIKDVSWFDSFLYSLGTSNNLIAATVGKIMRNAQINSSRELAELQHKVDMANAKLYKAGYNSKFMYENQKHIVSDIDWGMYEAAKEAKEKAFRKQGLRDFDLQEAMEDWEWQNTEDRIVDKTTGRTERVPGAFYRKTEDFQKNWSPEQKEYYEVMMEYKGEIETNYPSYAQNYYLPPQIRRNFVDALGNAHSAKDVGIAFLNKFKDLYTVREDDPNYVENSIVDGGEARFVEGDYDNTPRKEIPVYFQKLVEDGELLLDFSSALLHEASSSYRYKALNEVKDTAETIRDYIDSQPAASPGGEAELTVDSRMMRMTKSLYKWGKKNNVSSMLNGFIDQNIYGIKRSSFDTNHKKLAKFVDSTIAYTSLKGLATNLPGAFANMAMGIAQIFIDTCSNEFFGFKDVGNAFIRLFGKNGIPGEIMEIASNNVHSKAKLLQMKFDPQQENFENIKNKRYYSNIFRHIISKDLRFIGYGAGEHLIHMIPLYAILNHEKVRLHGEEISLYKAYEVKKKDHNSELVLKEGVTDLDGNPITQKFIDRVKDRIRYANTSMHGGMSEGDKGLIHQYMLGRLAANFHQWMIGHYSRRFRGRHMDDALGEWREGYYTSVWKFFFNDDTRDAWKAGHQGEALGLLMKDLFAFTVRSTTQMQNLDEMQKYNIKRARAEICMFFTLVGLSFALGDSEDHKKEWWRRWWIYQTKRMITETGASMPGHQIISNMLTTIQSPMAGVNVLNSLLYTFYGLGDITEDIKSGPHKGENRYFRNIIKYDLPFFKDWEKLQTFDENESLFKVFDVSPSTH